MEGVGGFLSILGVGRGEHPAVTRRWSRSPGGPLASGRSHRARGTTLILLATYGFMSYYKAGEAVCITRCSFSEALVLCGGH